MAPYKIDTADILEWAASYTGSPFHALISDTPYNLESIQKRFGKPDSAPAKGGVYNRAAKGFMNAQWDTGICFRPETWYELAKHLHPGGFILAFSGSRTWHRMAVAMEDAGLIMHPSLYLYYSFGSGFPKATRVRDQGADLPDFEGYRYGLQSLKPAVEIILCAQRPYEGRPVDNIQSTGAGVWNIDGGRLPTNGESPKGSGNRESWRDMESRDDVPDHDGNETDPLGRWPSHFILQHNPECRYTVAGWQCGDGCAVERLGAMSGESTSNGNGKENLQPNYKNEVYNRGMGGPTHAANQHADTGTAARFFFQSHWSYDIYERLNHADSVFYTSKTSTREREAGLDDLPPVTRNRVNSGGYENDPKWKPTQRRNNHPTLKPLALTKYLATLLLPPAIYAPRRILIPFAGSGSEMIGAMLAGFDEIHGCELMPEYARIATHRLHWWHKQMQWGCSDPEIILAASDEKKGDSAGVQLSLLEAP